MGRVRETITTYLGSIEIVRDLRIDELIDWKEIFPNVFLLAMQWSVKNVKTINCIDVSLVNVIVKKEFENYYWASDLEFHYLCGEEDHIHNDSFTLGAV